MIYNQYYSFFKDYFKPPQCEGVARKRVRIFEGNPTKQILTYTEAVRRVDPIYEAHGEVSNARVILAKAVQADHKAVDDLASIWCEWAEMELRHNNLKGAVELIQRVT
ncbi:hypothetical protein SASPL_119941 [Salvia splendens]|uniref:Pre-mRNA-splicing factor Syf1/CRNKL1-like C-terminal HAT-repeats domain-containing protein n=1 Tax=Salvia splendens TaxID=180675 RepID=A0A8X8YXE5_SALSN|nr:hypothetical protein SASPL_156255 [Salvia splendens]KAG6417748.1 hypothetical protein SASPL_119941 [Salvia splendens]